MALEKKQFFGLIERHGRWWFLTPKHARQCGAESVGAPAETRGTLAP
jgi:hypothetical protein